MKRNYGVLVMFRDLCVKLRKCNQFEKIQLLSLYDTYVGYISVFILCFKKKFKNYTKQRRKVIVTRRWIIAEQMQLDLSDRPALNLPLCNIVYTTTNKQMGSLRLNRMAGFKWFLKYIFFWLCSHLHAFKSLDLYKLYQKVVHWLLFVSV